VHCSESWALTILLCRCHEIEQKREERERHPVNQREKHLLYPVSMLSVTNELSTVMVICYDCFEKGWLRYAAERLLNLADSNY